MPLNEDNFEMVTFFLLALQPFTGKLSMSICRNFFKGEGKKFKGPFTVNLIILSSSKSVQHWLFCKKIFFYISPLG